VLIGTFFVFLRFLPALRVEINKMWQANPARKEFSMIKVFATEVVISKGFDGAAALRFSENGDSVRFRFGKRVYDTRAENNTRWLNCSAKAFGAVCERIKKMQLKEGSYVNLLGRWDEDTWTDQTTNEKKSAMVVILDEIEYCSSGGGKQSKETNNADSQTQANTAAPAAPAQSSEMPQNFTGFEPFGGGNTFFDET
jgi:single-stranded DNA-binding protein